VKAAPPGETTLHADNPYVESLFGTMKTRVGYPRKPFATLEEAQAWVDHFVRWYDEEHRQSALNG
jgi:transposase InsO family protein